MPNYLVEEVSRVREVLARDAPAYEKFTVYTKRTYRDSSGRSATCKKGTTMLMKGQRKGKRYGMPTEIRKGLQNVLHWWSFTLIEEGSGFVKPI